jgi:uncharacterized membrane protein
MREGAREALLVILLAAVVSAFVVAVFFGMAGRIPTVGLESIAIAILFMVIIAVLITLPLYFVLRRYAAERAVRVAMMTLTEDEQTVLRPIMEAGGELRQDHLRRRLDFSKSKLSALVNNLERKKVITKKRFHKTNILKLTKEFGGR